MVIGYRFIFGDMQTSYNQTYCLFLFIFITPYCSGAADFQTFFILNNKALDTVREALIS